MNEKEKKRPRLSGSDRKEIEILKAKGYSIGEIARVFNRSKSGIWYELQKKRKKKNYDATYAKHLSYVRIRQGRKVGKRIALNPELRKFVEKHLFDDQSPEEVSKTIKRKEKDLPYISASAIRRYVKSPYGRKIEDHRNKVFKKKYKRKGSKKRILGKRMIDQRPKKIARKWGLGHMEVTSLYPAGVAKVWYWDFEIVKCVNVFWRRSFQ